MEEKKIFKELEKMLREEWELDKTVPITLETNFKIDLGKDSLDIYEFAYKVEENLDIPIPDGEIVNFEYVGDLVKYLNEQIK
jgi:acyl carrier protein